MSMLVLAICLGNAVVGCGDQNQPDTTPPADVSDLRAKEVGRSSTTLLWTAPGDDGESGQALAYEVRRADETLTLAAWDSTGTVVAEPPSAPAGSAESLLVESLAENHRYYFALRTVDEAGNRSGISNVVSLRTASSDTIPPAAVTSLTLGRVSSREAFVAWLAPGDDDTTNGRAARYQLRLADETLTLENWDTTGAVVDSSAPIDPGQLELHQITDLLPRHTYYVALRTRDEAFNWSGISNVVRIDTPADDTVPPGKVFDLAGRLTAIDAIEITFTAPGDDGYSGQAFEYDLRYAMDPDALENDWENTTRVETKPPQSAGRREAVLVDSLPIRTQYYFGLRTSDEAELWSELSNIAPIRTSDSTCVVLADSTGDYPTIRDALIAGAGCTILLGDGEYPNNVWPADARPHLRSLSGDARSCVLRFPDGTSDLGTQTILEGVTLADSPNLRIRAVDAPMALQASGCILLNVSFEAAGPFAAGPDVLLEDCLVTEATQSPVFNVDRFTARRCTFLDNRTRLVVAREVEIEACSFTGNQIPSGALLRTFHDIDRGSLLRVDRSTLTGNSGTLLSLFNGPLLVENSVIGANSGSAISLSGQTAATVRTTTFINNFGLASCIRSEALLETLRIERCIFAANNDGPEVFGDPRPPLIVTCTDVYGNERGDWTGDLTGYYGRDGNISRDPLFCDRQNADFRLSARSPCSPDSQPDCGRIGALDVACP
ncbi:MAG: hypothetical protein R3E12_14150 [Candidatus Eisenbacteria bacterium]|uniref:Fibronectin type-III domain-containing protein n=1 Tax=Eiseniibacteriota bacterium TaxID=2212470 RepID=A0A956LZC5_UNCEI|nr:hypothetical protein [Candidatus Eisenbacteria bacterium]